MKIEITDTTTGEAVTYHDNSAWDEGQEFSWSENNFSCDCNRGICFYRAQGVPEEDLDADCGHSRFAVRIWHDDGRLAYEDDRPDAAA